MKSLRGNCYSLFVLLGALFVAPCTFADSLGETVARLEHAGKPSPPVLCSAKAGNMNFKITNLVLTKSLYLPDALRARTIRPDDGRLIIVLEGRAVNEGHEKASYEEPQLLAVDGGKHEVFDKLYYKRSGSTSLNPAEYYPFVVCYMIAPKLIEGSKLLCSDDSWIAAKTGSVILPIDSSAQIEERYALSGVTDNMFDREKVQNRGEVEAEAAVARAGVAAEQKKAAEAAERRRQEWKESQDEAEMNYRLKRLESAARELENGLRQLDREAESAARELENELRNLDREVESAARDLENELRNLQFDSDF